MFASVHRRGSGFGGQRYTIMCCVRAVMFTCILYILYVSRRLCATVWIYMYSIYACLLKCSAVRCVARRHNSHTFCTTRCVCVRVCVFVCLRWKNYTQCVVHVCCVIDGTMVLIVNTTPPRSLYLKTLMRCCYANAAATTRRLLSTLWKSTCQEHLNGFVVRRRARAFKKKTVST